MQAVIFAAGKSTRTYPLTLTRPKPLLKVWGKTIIEHNIGELKGLVDEVILIVGYHAEMFEEVEFDIKTRLVRQDRQDGNASALMLAKDLIKDRFIVMNGDDFFCASDIKRCIRHRYCVLGKEMDSLERFGQIIIAGGKAKEIKEKPGSVEGVANTGLYVFDKEVFKMPLKKSVRSEYEITEAVRWLNTIESVEVENAAEWLPITYPWNLLDAAELLAKRSTPTRAGKIERYATLKGDVWVGKSTLIRSGAYIEGPVYIGDNCIIGPNCYIRAGSSIGDNCKIGNAVEIKNSVIGNGSCVGHLSYIGDSVLGDKVNIGAGTITANLRHDEGNVKSKVKEAIISSGRRKLGTVIGDGAHTGIHTSIYPGRKIWPDKVTLPGEIVKEDKGE